MSLNHLSYILANQQDGIIVGMGMMYFFLLTSSLISFVEEFCMKSIRKYRCKHCFDRLKCKVLENNMECEKL